MRRQQVLIVGEAAVDVLVQCGTGGIVWGQAEQVVDDARLVLGSSGAITAAALAALGVDVAFVGVVGDDHLGRFFAGELSRLGVDTSGIVTSRLGSTGMTVVLARSGDRALLTYPGTMSELVAGDVPAGRIEAASHVHISSYFLQAGLHTGLSALLDSASTHGTTTSLDPGWDPENRWDEGLLELLGHLDWFLPNEAEAVRVAGRLSAGTARAAPPRDATGHDLGAVLDLVAAAGCGVAVKLAGAGGIVRHNGRTSRLATTPLVPVDTTGAGDSFDAGFIAGLLTGGSPAAALALGVACGRTAVGGLGGTGRLARRPEAETLAAELGAAGPMMADPLCRRSNSRGGNP